MTSIDPQPLFARKRSRKLVGLAGLALFGSVLASTCNACYVARSAWFQGELLLAREPLENIRSSGELNAQQFAKLDLIEDVKKYGGELGLAATENYSRIAWDWKRTIWNLSACEPHSFESETWWFPVVGTVPYLGFFRRKDAEPWMADLNAKGLDVYLRTAGAYSTLGYFEDPILPGMLDWEDDQLANTVLHEMVHATVWIKGSVSFNESLASFVGDNASLDYLRNRFGTDSQIVQRTLERREDVETWRSLQRDLFDRLNAAYSNPTLNHEEKSIFKANYFKDWPTRVRDADFNAPERFIDAAVDGVWNNARLMQFKTYNSQQDLFQRVLDSNDGDYLKFLAAVNEITQDASDPFEALESALVVQNF